MYADPRLHAQLEHAQPLTGDWRMHSRPFRHLRASDVLDGQRYAQLARSFTQLLEAPGAFSAGAVNYDAQIMEIGAALAPHFAPFTESHWLAGIAQAFGLPFHPVVDFALHSSPPGSRTGWVHTDLCTAWFDEATRGDGLFFPNRAKLEYFSGHLRDPSARPVAYARAATVIYYLCNDGWRAGDGGETALYAAGSGAHGDMAAVPPLNNTLLAFECSPHSYHRFLHNPGLRRNSLIFWLHLPAEQAAARWGDAFPRGMVRE